MALSSSAQLKVCLAGFAGVLLFVATTIIGGALHPGYSHVSQFISELYAVNAPYADALRFIGFLPSGLLITYFSFSARRQVPASARARAGFAGIGIFYGAFTVLVSIFNCDEGCNKKWVDPSLSQIIHNAAGLFTYLVVPVSLILLGIEAKNWIKGEYLAWWSLAAGVAGSVMVVVFFLNPASSYAGLMQRTIELSILSWILACAYYLRK